MLRPLCSVAGGPIQESLQAFDTVVFAETTPSLTRLEVRVLDDDVP